MKKANETVNFLSEKVFGRSVTKDYPLYEITERIDWITIENLTDNKEERSVFNIPKSEYLSEYAKNIIFPGGRHTQEDWSKYVTVKPRQYGARFNGLESVSPGEWFLFSAREEAEAWLINKNELFIRSL